MKNPNKTGSVFKLKGNRRRPWVARVTTGWQTVTAQKGKRAGQEYAQPIFHVIGYFITREEATLALSRYHTDPTPGSDITLAELYEEWSAIKYPRISPPTAKNYKNAWKKVQHLGRHRFVDLRTKHWQESVDNSGLGLSGKKKILTVLSLLYNYAMQNDIARQNYSRFVELPKKEKKDMAVFGDIEIKKLEDSLKVHGVDTIIFLIYTGLRVSEALSLTRFNVSLEQGIITGGAKSDAGKNRIIPIHPKLLPIIKTWLNKEGETLICREGKRISDNYYRKYYFHPALKVLGLPQRTPHACRHTCATLLSRAGADTLSIQRIMGHASYAFTADVYTHPAIEELRKAISKI